MSISTHQPDKRINVVYACDNIQALPLGVSIASALENRAEGNPINIHVLSYRISRSNRKSIASQFDGRDDTLFWHEITGENRKLLEDLFTSSNRPYPPAAYARLLISEVIPNIDRAIYLDTDIIVATDLSPLWNTSFDGAGLLAIQDLPTSNDHIKRLRALLSPEDISRYGIEAGDSYFQSGVLVFDMKEFTKTRASELIECLRNYPDLTFPDNDALNIVFHDSFKLVDPRWNQMASVFKLDAARDTPYSAEVFEALLQDPYIIHYSGRPKPWEDGCTHPYLDRWVEALTHSAWNSWKPSRLNRAIDRIPRIQRVLAKRFRRFVSQHV
ncbi:MAG: glycosyltransferase family 8 protein [Salipiger thiooxidans]|uniref:glycosyltransferase family 8 protein n=1 Tax=Salipiger thiooxidans TaxID=282683 RepID=UPI001CF9E794|nr:glycosyltransferase family 8 protein [Salipiger thiooxidans]